MTTPRHREGTTSPKRSLEAILADFDSVRPKTVPVVRRLRQRWSRELAHLPGEALLRLAEEMVTRGSMERFVAYELVAHHAGARDRLDERQLRRLARGMADWGSVDCFACYLSGPAWREGRVAGAAIHRWARSPDFWWRRAALVSTVPLNMRSRGGQGDAQRTLALCRILRNDREDMVVKALSWALRALATRDPKATRAFVARYEKDLAPRILREVRSKLETGRKNPRRLLSL
jgi:3-methyladenine DNA glycosylase AlkD